MLARAESYQPTGRSFSRLRRLGLLRDLEPSEVAAAVVAGVQDDRPQVRLPRRAAFAGALAEAPQALVDDLLAGGPLAVNR
jgi:hypothetical protein